MHGQRPITADTALRLGLFFGMEPRFWLNLQSEYDMRVANRELRAKIAPRIRTFQPVPTCGRGASNCSARPASVSEAEYPLVFGVERRCRRHDNGAPGGPAPVHSGRVGRATDA